MQRHKRTASAAIAPALLLALFGGDAAGQDDPIARYRACLALAAEAPDRALAEARSWEEAGGGNAARECIAMALLRAERFAEAGARFEALAGDLAELDPARAAIAWTLAGRSWLQAAAPQRAYDALSRALATNPDDAVALELRGMAAANLDDYAGAIADLSRALDAAPASPGLLLLRAAAYRMLGDHTRALADADRAVATDPSNPELLLERGNIRRLMGDRAGAEADWRRTVNLAPDSPAGRDARVNLDRLGRPNR